MKKFHLTFLLLSDVYYTWKEIVVKNSETHGNKYFHIEQRKCPNFVYVVVLTFLEEYYESTNDLSQLHLYCI